MKNFWANIFILFGIFFFFLSETMERGLNNFLTIPYAHPAFLRWVLGEKLFQPEGFQSIFPIMQILAIVEIFLGIYLWFSKNKLKT